MCTLSYYKFIIAIYFRMDDELIETIRTNGLIGWVTQNDHEETCMSTAELFVCLDNKKLKSQIFLILNLKYSWLKNSLNHRCRMFNTNRYKPERNGRGIQTFGRAYGLHYAILTKLICPISFALHKSDFLTCTKLVLYAKQSW